MSTKGVYDYDSTQDRLTQIADYSADQLSDIVNVYGSKNLNGTVYSNFESSQNYGIKWTVESDGTLTATGTSTANSVNPFYNDHSKYFIAPCDGQVFLSGLNSGNSSIHIFPIDETDGSVRPYKDSSKTERLSATDNVYNGNEISFYMVKGHKYTIYCRFNPNQTATNLRFKPMIRLASIEDDTYQPYAKTNKQLTDDSANKIDLTSINITSGTTNNTGSTIASSTFFYYKGSLVRAKTDIANGATLTENTNYEVVTAGGLNALNSDLNNTTNTTVGDVTLFKRNKRVFAYGVLDSLDSLSSKDIGTVPSGYRPKLGYCVSPLYQYNSNSYIPIGTIWIDHYSGDFTVYKPTSITKGYYCIDYETD